MSRTTALAASVALFSLFAGTAIAGDPVQTPATAPRAPASAEVRATYNRTDALTRSLFWSEQQEIDPSDPLAGVRAAQAMREMGRYDQAAEAAQRTLVTQPANYDALLELGRAHIARGQAFYGVAPLEQARALKPGEWQPLSLLGVAYEQVRRSDDARTAWNEALRLSPDNPDILTNVALSYMTRGDAASAETLLRRAADQPGASLKVRQNLAMVLGLSGKTGEAEAILRRYMPPEQADRNLAWLRERSGANPATSGDTARSWTSLSGS